MSKCLKHKNKRKQDRMSESTNFTIDDPYLVEKKNLGKREVRKMLIVRENTSRKELLLDCSVITHMFDE